MERERFAGETDVTDEKDPYVVPGLKRGLAVLQTFTPSRPELTLSEIAGALAITRSAAFRSVHTLVSEGYLLPTQQGHHYRLGPSVLRLSYGYHASRELLEVAQPTLEQLRDEIDWSTHLGVLDGRHVLYLLRMPAAQGLSSLVHVGSRLPAATTAMGRIFLARKTERELRQLYGDLDRGSLARVLEAQRQDIGADHVESIGRFESGISSVAAPVLDMSGEVVAAVSATNVTDAVPSGVVEAVRKAATAMSMGLGWRGE